MPFLKLFYTVPRLFLKFLASFLRRTSSPLSYLAPCDVFVGVFCAIVPCPVFAVSPGPAHSLPALLLMMLMIIHLRTSKDPICFASGPSFSRLVVDRLQAAPFLRCLALFLHRSSSFLQRSCTVPPNRGTEHRRVR